MPSRSTREKEYYVTIKLNKMKTLELRIMPFEEMSIIEGGTWKCALGIGGGFLVGFAGATGSGVAFFAGPIGVTWGFLGGIGGAIAGGAGAC